MNKFIIIKNQLITEKHEHHLNMEQLYLYSTLLRHKGVDDRFPTSLSVIHEMLTIPFAHRKDRSIKEIKRILDEISAKGIISITHSDGSLVDSASNLKASDVVIINMPELEGTGHAQVPIAQISKIDSLSDYYIYVATKRWDGTDNKIFKCPYERWANILQVSISTAQKYIQQAINNKVVYVNTGSYNKTGKQSMNEYKCTPFTAEQKSTAQKIKDSKSITESSESVSEQSESESNVSVFDKAEQPQVAHSEPQESLIDDDLMNSTISIFSNFLDDDGNDSFPNADDYLLVMRIEQDIKDRNRKATKLERELSNKCKWRMDMMKRSAMAKMKMEQEITKAKRMLAEQNGELDEQVDEQREVSKGNVVPFKVVEQQKKQYIDMSKYF